MASSINASTSGAGGVITTADNSGILNIQTAGTLALTVDGSQNISIGGTAPSQILTIFNATSGIGIGFGEVSNNYSNIFASYSGGALVLATGMQGSRSSDAYTSSYGGAAMYRNAIRLDAFSGTGIQFFTNSSSTVARGTAVTPTEAMRIDSSGNLLVGTTTAGISNSLSTTIEKSGYDNSRITVNHSSGGSSNGSYFMQFGYGGAVTGTISQATTSSVAYNTSSDYRLKENIAPMLGALDKVAKLKPVTYSWKSDSSDGEGFIAHELAEVCPQCVTGEKDAVDAEGKPIYQGIDTSFLVATLTAAIQELNAKVDAQAAEIAALKGVK